MCAIFVCVFHVIFVIEFQIYNVVGERIAIVIAEGIIFIEEHRVAVFKLLAGQNLGFFWFAKL